jgi:hypothetical protein
VKYMLLIYNNPATFDSLPEEERDALMGEVDALMAELTESGEWVGGEALADSSQTRTVRVRGGVPAGAAGHGHGRYRDVTPTTTSILTT